MTNESINVLWIDDDDNNELKDVIERKSSSLSNELTIVLIEPKDFKDYVNVLILQHPLLQVLL